MSSYDAACNVGGALITGTQNILKVYKQVKSNRCRDGTQDDKQEVKHMHASSQASLHQWLHKTKLFAIKQTLLLL